MTWEISRNATLLGHSPKRLRNELKEHVRGLLAHRAQRASRVKSPKGLPSKGSSLSTSTLHKPHGGPMGPMGPHGPHGPHGTQPLENLPWPQHPRTPPNSQNRKIPKVPKPQNTRFAENSICKKASILLVKQTMPRTWPNTSCGPKSTFEHFALWPSRA